MLDSLTVWQLDSLTVWQLDSLTVWQSDSLTVLQYDGLTFLQYDSLTSWQSNSLMNYYAFCTGGNISSQTEPLGNKLKWIETFSLVGHKIKYKLVDVQSKIFSFQLLHFFCFLFYNRRRKNNRTLWKALKLNILCNIFVKLNMCVSCLMSLWIVCEIVVRKLTNLPWLCFES